MRARLFSKLTLLYVLIMLVLCVVLDAFTERAVREALASGESADGVIIALRLKFFLVYVLGALAVIAISLLFSIGRIRRFELLRSFSSGLGQGEFRPLSLEGPSDEIAHLAEALNSAGKRIDQTIRALAGERDRSGAILRSMVEGVGVIDAHQKLVFCNQAFAEILNLEPDAVEGRPLIEVIRNTKVLQLIRRALNGGESLQDEISTGIVQLRMFSVTAAPVRATDYGSVAAASAAAKPSGAVVVMHEVTEIRRLERIRQDFVANISHEFKTPLTAIQGFSETLLGGALEDEANNRRFVEIIRDQATQLARVTNDLLKLARIEAGKLEMHLGAVNFAEVVDLCSDTTQLRASRKGITFEADLPAELPAVRGDARLLREVLQNLLDNAVQYTPKGGKVVVEAEEGPRDVTVSVVDTGIGIPLADQERIFERFYRVDAARSREEGGTGLGLSIARHIVETLGGHIVVESEVGRGSRFSFSIPKAG